MDEPSGEMGRLNPWRARPLAPETRRAGGRLAAAREVEGREEERVRALLDVVHRRHLSGNPTTKAETTPSEAIALSAYIAIPVLDVRLPEENVNGRLIGVKDG